MNSSDSNCLGVSDGIVYNYEEIVVYSILCTIFCLYTVIGNVLVATVIVKEPRINKHDQNLYLLSLAVADALLALLVVPFNITNELLGYWPFRHAYCRVFQSLDVALCTASIWNIVCIGLDRFASIKFPVFFRNYRTKKKIRIVIVSIWMYSVTVSIIPYLAPTDLILENSNSCFLFDTKWYIILCTSLSFFVPASFVAPAYIGIYYVGWKFEAKNKSDKSFVNKSAAETSNRRIIKERIYHHSESSYSGSVRPSPVRKTDKRKIAFTPNTVSGKQVEDNETIFRPRQQQASPDIKQHSTLELSSPRMITKQKKTAELQVEVLLENSASFASAKSTSSHQQKSHGFPAAERSSFRSLERKPTMSFVKNGAEVKQNYG